MNPPTTGNPTRLCEILSFGALAGAAGGLAEILWVVLYGAVSGNDIAIVARSIATIVGAALPLFPMDNAPVISGIAIHMFLSVALGIALAYTWRALSSRKAAVGREYQLLSAALAIVWAFNFFILLPLIGMYSGDLHWRFADILPYPVSLLSKLMFGLAAAAVFRVWPSRAAETNSRVRMDARRTSSALKINGYSEYPGWLRPPAARP